ncbi:hypothetical protein GCM10027039_30250 [Terrabacter koreensis]
MRTIKVTLTRISAALARRADKVKVRTTRHGAAHRAMTWVFWNRRNAMRTLIVTMAALTLAVLVFTRLTTYRHEVTQYEEQLRAEAAAKVASVSPSSTPKSEATYRELGSTEGTDTEATEPVPEPTTTPAAPSLTPTGPPVIASGVPDVEQAPRKVAGTFLKTWAGAASYPNTGEWLDAMAPYTTQAMLDLFRLTDVTRVSPAKVKSMTSVTTGSSSAVDASMSDGQILSITLEVIDGRWKVTDLDEAL